MTVTSGYSNFLAAPMQGPSAVCAKPPELPVGPQQGHPVSIYEKKERREQRRAGKRRAKKKKKKRRVLGVGPKSNEILVRW